MSASNESRNGRKWTTAQLQRLIALWIQDADIDEMAKEFGFTRHAINTQIYRMRRQGIPIPRRKNGHKAGRRNQWWTPEEIEFLVRRRADKATAETIAEELGRSFCGVQAMIAKLRSEGVEVRRLCGTGSRRLWDPGTIIAACAGRHLRLVRDENETSDYAEAS